MKLWTGATLLSAAALLAAGTLTALGTATPIVNSKHNMNKVFGANTIVNNEICRPCHAPHNQPDQSLDALWNHVMPANSYTLFDSTAGYVGLDDTSRMCLSCHDGTVGVDAYGGHTGGTLKLASGVTDVDGNDTGGYIIGKGQNLQHDHPVGVLYPGLTVTSTSATFDTSKRFKDPSKWSSTGYETYVTDPSTGVITANPTKWVDNSGANIKAVGGPISLAKRNDTDYTGSIVGCGTCHTPHTSTYNFLRVPNTNSQLCLMCHDK